MTLGFWHDSRADAERLLSCEKKAADARSDYDIFYGLVDLQTCRTVEQPWWDDFYSPKKQPQDVIMMGQSMARAFTPALCRTFLRWCTQGARMRILFLSPNATASSQLFQIGQEIDYQVASRMQLQAKILDSVENLQRNLISHIPDADKAPMVRFATRDLPFSMMVVDDRMLVTLYGSRAEADESLTFEIQGHDTVSYRAFKSEFQHLWDRHSKIHPHEDPLIKYLQTNWRTLVSLRDLNESPPVPQQAILYPTYRCS